VNLLKSKKGEIVGILTVLLLLAAAAIIVVNNGGNITGQAIYAPAFCQNNLYSCIDLNGDGKITMDDEDIYAMILNGNYTQSQYPDIYNMSDFDNNGIVDQVDFQQCFVPLRDYYVDQKNRDVPCNRPTANLTNRTNHTGCTNGCADLTGDGYVRLEDFVLLLNTMGKRTNETIYPMADLTGDGFVDMEDKFCFTPYYGDVVMCNLPTNYYHNYSRNCPDLTNEFGTGNDGRVDDIDKALFDQYKSTQNLKADFNNDGYVDWLDKYIFNQYYGKIVDCNLYHAPWHIGGIDQSNSNTTGSGSPAVGGTRFASQSFITTREGQLAKVRVYLRANLSLSRADITVKIFPDNGIGEPNMSVLIPPEATIQITDDNQSHWETAYFKVPPVLANNTKYHVVLSSPGSANAAYQWITSINATAVGDALSSINSGSTWTNITNRDYVYEMFSSTACADINGDGIVDNVDEAIISSIPDNADADGTGNWNATYDINRDHKVDNTDVNLINTAIAGGVLTTPALALNNSLENGSKTFGGNIFWKAQSFMPNDLELSKVELYLAANSNGRRDISVEIWDGVWDGVINRTIPGSRYANTTIIGFTDFSFRWYNATFSNAVNLVPNTTYFIVLYSSTPALTGYNWSKGTNYSEGEEWDSINNGTTWMNASSYDFAFRIYNGDPNYNSSYDVNNDSLIDNADLALVQAAVPSWDGSFWTPLVDFNAIFGVYEQLRDKTLGFDAYTGTVLKCGLPTYTVSCGDGRCEDDYESFSSCPIDCIACNNDSFCAKAENVSMCGDCVLPPAIPRYYKFNASTTDFENVANINSVSNAILEIWPYGKIEFLQTINFTGLNLDRYVNITYNNISIDMDALPRLNVSARITLYNLSSVYPRILRNSNNCEGIACSYLDFVSRNLRFTVTGFNLTPVTYYSTINLAPDISEFNGSTTNFNRNYVSNIENVSNIVLEVAGKGKVNFLVSMNASNLNFSRYVDIDQNLVSIDSTSEPRLDVPVKITLNNVSQVYPGIINSTGYCIDNCKIVSYTGGNLIFNSTGPGNYSSLELAPNTTGFNGNTTNFNYRAGLNIRNVSGVIIELLSYGKIEYLASMNASNINFARDVIIGNTYVEVNSTAEPKLNAPAKIYLYNISVQQVLILKDSVPCGNNCSILYYGGSFSNPGLLIFNVAGFTRYEIIENDTSPHYINGPFRVPLWRANSNQTIANLSHYFFDADNRTLLYSWISHPNITVHFNATTTNIILEPSPGWYGYNGWVIFNASDGNASHAHATTGFVPLTVLPNRPPLFTGPIAYTPSVWYEDNIATINLSNYFTDPDGDRMTFDWTFVGTGQNQENITVNISQSTGKVILTPKANWYGKDYIVFNATDNQYTTKSTAKELTVVSVNDIPFMLRDIQDIVQDEDTNITINLTQYFADVEDNGTRFSNLNFSLVNAPVNFNYNYNRTTAMLKLVPTLDWYGYESFTLKAVDSNNGTNYSNSFTIYLNSVSDNVRRNGTLNNITWQEDTNKSVDLSMYYYDPDSDWIIFSASLPTYVSIILDRFTGALNLIPNANWTGIDYVNITVNDDVSQVSDIILLNVTPVNDAPAWNFTLAVINLSEDTLPGLINLNNYAYDIDGDALNYTLVSQSNTNLISCSISSQNLNCSMPAANKTGDSIVAITARDSQYSATGSVRLSVLDVNDAPSFNSSNPIQSIVTILKNNASSEINLAAHFYDIDSNSSLNYSSTLMQNISVAIDNNTGIVTLTPDANFTGAEYVQFRATDGLLWSAYSNVVKIVITDGPSEIINSRFNGTPYNGNYSAANITDVIISTIIDSNITYWWNIVNSRLTNVVLNNSDLTDTNATNSTILNSRLVRCVVINSTVKNYIGYDCYIVDSTVDPPTPANDLTGSNITGNSNVMYSDVLYSNISSSHISNSQVNTSNITNSTVINSIVINASIVNGVICWGIVNGTTYYNANGTCKNLTDIINYPPVAAINAAPTSGTSLLNVTFNGVASSDPNIPGQLNDSLNYTWEFGDSTNATGNITSHAYSTGTFNAKLTIIDNYGAISTTTVAITVSGAAPSGGGGGGGGRACTPVWQCLEWGNCFAGKQTRTCTDIKKCGKITGKPSEIQSCVCEEKWICSDWSPALCPFDKMQTKNCEDTSRCGTEANKPQTTKSCIYTGTCYDNIINQGEEGIDCGGPCRQCAPAVEKPIAEKSYAWLYALLMIIIAGGISFAIYEVERAHKSTKSEKQQNKLNAESRQKLEDYIRKTLAEGFSKEEVRDRLLKEGWSKYLIDDILNSKL